MSMSRNDITLPDSGILAGAAPPERLALSVLWCRDDGGGTQGRVGQVLVLPLAETSGELTPNNPLRQPGEGSPPKLSRAVLFGRRGPEGVHGLNLVYPRPPHFLPAPPMVDARLSKNQLRLEVFSRGDLKIVRVENLGKRPLLQNGSLVERAPGQPTEVCYLRIGDTLEVRGVIAFVLIPLGDYPAMSSREVTRLFPPEGSKDWSATDSDGLAGFGKPDVWGFVGEGALAWRLRAAVNRACSAPGLVLLLGPRGEERAALAAAICDAWSDGAPPLKLEPGATPLAALQALLRLEGREDHATLLSASELRPIWIEELSDVSEGLQRRLVEALGATSRGWETAGPKLIVTMDATVGHGAWLRRYFQQTIVVPPISERLGDLPLIVEAELAESAASRDELLRQGFQRGLPTVGWALTRALVHWASEQARRGLQVYAEDVRIEFQTCLWESLERTQLIEEQVVGEGASTAEPIILEPSGTLSTFASLPVLERESGGGGSSTLPSPVDEYVARGLNHASKVLGQKVSMTDECRSKVGRLVNLDRHGPGDIELLVRQNAVAARATEQGLLIERVRWTQALDLGGTVAMDSHLSGRILADANRTQLEREQLDLLIHGVHRGWSIKLISALTELKQRRLYYLVNVVVFVEGAGVGDGNVSGLLRMRENIEFSGLEVVLDDYDRRAVKRLLYLHINGRLLRRTSDGRPIELNPEIEDLALKVLRKPWWEEHTAVLWSHLLSAAGEGH